MTPPPPDAGPGSTSSQAHQYFDSTVYPTLAVCQACHSTGTDGAPEMMNTPADTTYSELDALGLIVTNSLLLTHGSHDSGKAPALDTDQQTAITQWLSLEAQERVGTAAPTNIYAQLASCASETEFDAIPWTTLVTQPRPDENPNRCTSCDGSYCASCHSGGEQGFYMEMGTTFDPVTETYIQTFQGPTMQTYINKYFGMNGATPIASNAILNKQNAVAAGPAYSHPMFVMPQPMETALNQFVTDTITAYTNHTCTGGMDGGTPEDAGQ